MNSFNLITKYFFKIKQDTCMRKKKWRGREQVGDRIKKKRKKENIVEIKKIVVDGLVTLQL